MIIRPIVAPSTSLKQGSVSLLLVLLRNYMTTVNTIALLRYPHQMGNATITDVILLLRHWVPQPPGLPTTSTLTTTAVPLPFRLTLPVRMTRINIAGARLLALQLVPRLRGLLLRHFMIAEGEGIGLGPLQPHRHPRVRTNAVIIITGSGKQHSAQQPPPV